MGNAHLTFKKIFDIIIMRSEKRMVRDILIFYFSWLQESKEYCDDLKDLGIIAYDNLLLEYTHNWFKKILSQYEHLELVGQMVNEYHWVNPKVLAEMTINFEDYACFYWDESRRDQVDLVETYKVAEEAMYRSIIIEG